MAPFGLNLNLLIMILGYVNEGDKNGTYKRLIHNLLKGSISHYRMLVGICPLSRIIWGLLIMNVKLKNLQITREIENRPLCRILGPVLAYLSTELLNWDKPIHNHLYSVILMVQKAC